MFFTWQEKVNDMHPYNFSLIEREDCLLLLIDIQEKLLPVIAEKEKIVDNVVKLVKFSTIIGMPIVVTEQEKLGSTVDEIKREISEFNPIQKICFDCFSCEGFVERIGMHSRKTLLFAGIEAHICVAQTVLHALPTFHAHVVADAISSRTTENKHLALRRMEAGGAVITSTEMVIYELLKKAGTEEFKAVLKLVK
jgi:isochorismate hydrolase